MKGRFHLVEWGLLIAMLLVLSRSDDGNQTVVVNNHTISGNTTTPQYDHAVKVFHFLLGHWGESRPGQISCGKIYCEWVLSDHIKHLKDNLGFLTPPSIEGLPLITLSMYNIHSWWEKTRDPKPAICELRTNLTMAETGNKQK
jgi:hypothetical protein